jgi:hypothetical protein
MRTRNNSTSERLHLIGRGLNRGFSGIEVGMYAQGERNTAYSRVTEKFLGAAWRCMPRALIITLQLILFSFHFISFFSGAVAAAAEQLRRSAHGNAFRCVLIARIVLCYYFSLLIRCRMFE